ncbi:MAG: aldehyde dehydrogenase (NADP(+)) [Acidobacteriaceae bacterium]|nr:aldehyde dehydrogenase (NADP(+)) [Acidobacteriaceae bacterium]
MQFHGQNFIGSSLSARGSKLIHAYNPREGKQLEAAFHEATSDEVDAALTLAEQAFQKLREINAQQTATFLETAATEIEALGDDLIDQAVTESGLTKDRLTGERGRTANQLRLFASLVREGSYVDARIDTALPDRKPLPRPDLRRMLIPIGPVVVFGASNFPLAFSVAGGDTASAFAAKNPVIVKAHPAHPGTSELVASAILRAVNKTGLPDGTFSMLHAADPEVSLSLVKHRAARAVGFTGSERAGRAIFNAAAQRPDPIPAYVEMGSINPVFLLPGALESSPDTIAQGLFASMNMGVGQFCTSPGVVIGKASRSFQEFGKKLTALIENGTPGTMLHSSILKGYVENIEQRSRVEGVATVRSSQKLDPAKTEATPVLFETDAGAWLRNRQLATEIFGPSAVLVRSHSKEELLRVATELHGTLTATIFGTPADLEENRELIAILEEKAGRLIFNGYPTGVEVSPAMHHGGPYPATADPKFTSVGTAAIVRFLRPVCFQNFPEKSLPAELQNANTRGIWRLVNGELTKAAIAS